MKLERKRANEHARAHWWPAQTNYAIATHWPNTYNLRCHTERVITSTVFVSVSFKAAVALVQLGLVRRPVVGLNDLRSVRGNDLSWLPPWLPVNLFEP